MPPPRPQGLTAPLDSSGAGHGEGRSMTRGMECGKQTEISPLPTGTSRRGVQLGGLNDSGFGDGSMADGELAAACIRSDIVNPNCNRSSNFVDEGLGNDILLSVDGNSSAKEESVVSHLLSGNRHLTNSRSPPPVLIQYKRRADGAILTVSQEEFRTMPVEEAAFCYITLYDAEWRNLSRRKEQAAREAANAALDIAYARDTNGRRLGFSAMFGEDWDKDAVYKVWKDLKRNVPRADPLERVLNWVLSDDVRNYAPDEVDDYDRDFLHLPERGKHFPNPNPAISVAIIEGYETSISRCASERGTHGHNSPVPVDPHSQKILDIYQELHRRQAKVKDQIVSGIITAETLEQQMNEEGAMQTAEDNVSELVHALDHFLGLRRASRTFYAVQGHMDKGNHDKGHHHSHHQLTQQQQQQQQQHQAGPWRQLAALANGYGNPSAPQVHHHQAGQHHTQQSFHTPHNPHQHYPQTHPAQPHHQHQHPAQHPAQQQQQQHLSHQHMPTQRLYPVHITNPSPFIPMDAGVGNLIGSPNGIYLPPMPHPSSHQVDNRRQPQPNLSGADGYMRNMPGPAMPQGKAVRRNKKTGPPFQKQLGSKNSFYTMPYQCLWQRCGRRFKSSQEMYTHVERQHILTDPGLLTGERGFSCQWHGCSTQDNNNILAQLSSPSTSNLFAGGGAGTQKHSPGSRRHGNAFNPRHAAPVRPKAYSFKARYQLLIHIQIVHCKEKMKFDEQVIPPGLSSGKDKPSQQPGTWGPNGQAAADHLSDIAESHSKSPRLPANR